METATVLGLWAMVKGSVLIYKFSITTNFNGKFIYLLWPHSMSFCESNWKILFHDTENKSPEAFSYLSAHPPPNFLRTYHPNKTHFPPNFHIPLGLRTINRLPNCEAPNFIFQTCLLMTELYKFCELIKLKWKTVSTHKKDSFSPINNK